ncbi:MAG: acylphosphatase [Oscillospiraceae bacterium]|nr:acylphosphatase [Oscillospiraceae bacterium]
MTVRRHIIFIGDVQGVGFRWRAEKAAQLYGVSGYVRNLPDGTVEAELEAEEEMIDKLIIAVSKGTYVRITDMKVRNMAPTGQRGFYTD